MKSILFNDEMVRAILDGRKTKTRRPITHVKKILGGAVTEFQESDTPGYDFIMRDKRKCWNDLRKEDLLRRCPFGQVGDLLWVRETFCLESQVEYGQPPPFNDGRPILYLRDGIECAKEDANTWLQPHYRATDPTPDLAYEDSDGEPTVRWKPSIHMPRWASRITLEITDIRVERVQEITEEEAISEGFFPDDGVSEVYCFSEAWDSLYAKKGLGWNDNPWVWVITFRRVEGC